LSLDPAGSFPLIPLFKIIIIVAIERKTSYGVFRSERLFVGSAPRQLTLKADDYGGSDARMNEEKPDLVVGVDFGMTFTGMPLYPDKPRLLQLYPLSLDSTLTDPSSGS
jgi:hypothetical protein